MVDGYNIGARNQHADSGAYEFHIHRAYIIYAYTHKTRADAASFILPSKITKLLFIY